MWFGYPRYWWCQLGGWGGVAALGVLVVFLVSQREIAEGINAALASAKSAGVRPDDGGNARFMTFTCLLGLVASHGWRVLILNQGWMRWPVTRLVWHAAAWWVGLTLLLSAITIRFFTVNLPEENGAANAIPAVMMNASLLGAWCAVYFLVHFHDAFHRANLDRAELAAAVAASQLLALQGQTNPHFLFNSLNTVRALMPATATEARRAITLLAETLRATLLEGKKASIPLARELEIVRAYLSLERLRFEEDLTVEEEIAPAALDVQVPSLMLQTLVENALKHGLLRTGGRGVLRLVAKSDDDAVWLRVRSPGTLDVEADATASLGIGLENVRERLRLLFGPEASLCLRAPQLGIIEAIVRIPRAFQPATNASR